MRKVLLLVTRKEATRAYEIDQLFRDLEAIMEGVMHHIRSLWDPNCDKEEDWVTLLIDTGNAFNEGKRKMILHESRHEWLHVSRFLLNLYMKQP